MKLAELINGNIKRYTFIPKETEKVWTLDYFEYDELYTNSYVYSDVRIISKEEYLQNKDIILEQLEDTIVCFENDFSKNTCWENMTEKEFLEKEHEFILNTCF